MTERHVCSLALSRRLAEAGFPQECVFAWYSAPSGDVVLPVEYATRGQITRITRRFAAPLLSEIMEQSSPNIFSAGHGPFGWTAEHVVDGGAICVAATGPDAAALLWLALRGA